MEREDISFNLVVWEGLYEDLTVEERHKMCIYVGRVSQVEGITNAKIIKIQGACHVFDRLVGPWHAIESPMREW